MANCYKRARLSPYSKRRYAATRALNQPQECDDDRRCQEETYGIQHMPLLRGDIARGYVVLLSARARYAVVGGCVTLPALHMRVATTYVTRYCCRAIDVAFMSPYVAPRFIIADMRAFVAAATLRRATLRMRDDDNIFRRR